MPELSGIMEVENPAETLRNQDGIFRVTSPQGQIFQVTCRKGSSMRIREIGESKMAAASEPKGWRIEKLARAVA